jgi:hypothetical protein
MQDLGHVDRSPAKRSTFMTAKKNHAKDLLIFTSLAILLMGADKKGCEKQAAVVEGPRQLKKIVQLDEVRVAPILLVSEEFDFGFQVNEEVPTAIDQAKFYVYKRLPLQNLNEVAANGDSGYFGVEKLSNGKEYLKLTTQAMGLDEVTLKQLNTWYPEHNQKLPSLSRDTSCLLSKPQYDLTLSVKSLEISNGGKIQFGFTPASSVALTGLSFSMDKSVLNLGIHAWSGITGDLVKSLNHDEPKKDYGGSIGIQLGPVNIGPQFYKKTGLQEVTRKGILNTFNKLTSATENDEWYSRVVLNEDQEMVFWGGQELNIKKGDIFTVEEARVLTNNNASVCTDDGVILGETPGSYTWQVEAVAVGRNLTRAKVLNPNPDLNIETGFKVRLEKRIEDILAEKEALENPSKVSAKAKK